MWGGEGWEKMRWSEWEWETVPKRGRESTRERARECVCTRADTHTYTPRMCVCVLCMCVCTCAISLDERESVCTHTRTYTYTYIHTHTPTGTHTNTHAHTHTHTHTVLDRAEGVVTVCVVTINFNKNTHCTLLTRVLYLRVPLNGIQVCFAIRINLKTFPRVSTTKVLTNRETAVIWGWRYYLSLPFVSARVVCCSVLQCVAVTREADSFSLAACKRLWNVINSRKLKCTSI